MVEVGSERASLKSAWIRRRACRYISPPELSVLVPRFWYLLYFTPLLTVLRCKRRWGGPRIGRSPGDHRQSLISYAIFLKYGAPVLPCFRVLIVRCDPVCRKTVCMLWAPSVQGTRGIICSHLGVRVPVDKWLQVLRDVPSLLNVSVRAET